MPRNHSWIAFSLLILVTASSCASSPSPKSTSDPFVSPSPTPFQPGLEAAPSSAPTFDSESVPTFTPYPTAVLKNGTLVMPQVSSSTGLPPIVIDPLTGLPPADPSLLERRPLAIKVTNYPRYVRPQAGLTLADEVFEYYIEGALTRFIAVFYGNNAAMVGPVRSGRYFDEHVVRMYHAFYVFQYADPRELMYFRSGDLNPFLVLQGAGNCPPFFNSDRQIETYNNAYFDITKWNECAAQLHLDNSPQDIRSGFFSETPPSGAPAATRIFTVYSADDYNYWQYDAASGRYLRYQETDDTRNNKPEAYAPLTDYVNGQQVAADNIIVLFVSYTFANDNEQQDEVYHVNLIDSGNAFVFRNGLAVPARWFRTDINQPLLITNLDGSPIYMKPGQTFFEVIGETSNVSQSGSDWHFEFQKP
ncbi:MAG TPA: DUF3048 domain-containing protein [Anaerolineales bacterium]|nr:DUF3048 domain-containing protein [Anaerolineales bacterium]